MILTIELGLAKARDLSSDDISEVAICCDQEGLGLLIQKLESLRNRVDHEHLMTPSWSGNELTEQRQGGENYVLVKHLRLVKVPSG